MRARATARDRQRARRAALALSVALATASACERGHEPPRGGTLVVAIRGDVDAWNPYVTGDATSAYLLDLLYPRLVREVPAGEGTTGPFAPWLASSWERAGDGRAWTFHLRSDARWSDGTPVGCDDVRATFGFQTDDALAWDGAFVKKRIAGVECPDPSTAVFRFTEAYDPSAQILDANDDAVVPRSYGELPTRSWKATAWEQRSKTCGPFRLGAIQPGVQAVLERDLGWWAAPDVRPDRVVLRVHPDASEAVDRLLEGEIDFVPRVPPENAGRFGGAGGARLEELPSLTFTYFGWNVLDPAAYADALRAGATDDVVLIERLRRERPHPILSDARVRRALAMAVDKRDIVQGVWAGHADPGDAPVPPSSWAHDAGAVALPFDPSAARALLAQAGWADRDGDGVADRQGRRFELRVLLNAENRVRRDVFERAAANLARVGVRLIGDPVPRAEFNARARDKRFDAILAGRAAGTRVEPQAILHGRAAAARGNNVTSWSTPESDALMDRAASAADGGVDSWRRWLRLYRDEQPLTVLYYERTLVGVGKRIHGRLPRSFNPFTGIPDLRVASE